MVHWSFNTAAIFFKNCNCGMQRPSQSLDAGLFDSHTNVLNLRAYNQLNANAATS